MRALGSTVLIAVWCSACITTRTGRFVAQVHAVDDHLVVVSCDTARTVTYVVDRFDEMSQPGCIVERLPLPAIPALAPVAVTP
jgi:hypothetical protein